MQIAYKDLVTIFRLRYIIFVIMQPLYSSLYFRSALCHHTPVSHVNK